MFNQNFSKTFGCNIIENIAPPLPLPPGQPPQQNSNLKVNYFKISVGNM